MTLDDIKTASPEDISEALLIWSNTIPDPDNNFDAQLLIRASEIIDNTILFAEGVSMICRMAIKEKNDKNSS